MSLAVAFAQLSRKSNFAPPVVATKCRPAETRKRTFEEAFADRSRKCSAVSECSGEDSTVKARKRKPKLTSALDARLRLGEELYEYKAGVSGKCHAWLMNFTRLKCPTLIGRDKRLYSQSCSRAFALYNKFLKGKVSTNKLEQGRRETGVRTASRTFNHRRNVVGGGRPIENQELSEELWDWFVSTITALKCRIDSAMLIAKAEELIVTIEKQNKVHIQKRG